MKEEKAKIAELRLEAAFLKEQQAQELAQKQLQVKLAMAKATAKLRIF